MKITLLLLSLVYSFSVLGTCSSPISRTNNSPNTVLTSTKYNTDINTVYTKVNDLDGDCITDSSIATAKLEDSSVTRAKLATGAIAPLVVQSKTANYTALYTDDIILVNGTSSSFAITLPSTGVVSGKVLIIKRTDNTMANVVSITGTIDGDTDYALYTIGEVFELAYNGSTWTVISHAARTKWANFASVAAGTLITATTTNPTYGTTANNVAQWRRNGSHVEIKWDYRQTTAGTAGAGNYLFNIPSFLSIDSSVLVNTQIGSTAGAGNDSGSIGEITLTYSTGTMAKGSVIAYSTTQLKGWLYSGGASAIWGPASFDFAVNAAAAFNIRAAYQVNGCSIRTQKKRALAQELFILKMLALLLIT
jgi:hypothetical protein